MEVARSNYSISRSSDLPICRFPDFRSPEILDGIQMTTLEVHDPGLNDLIAPDASIERVAGGMVFTEGPVWRGGALLFSDIPKNRIARWRGLPEGPETTDVAYRQS